mgnify:CR=1 FL=1
MKPAPALYIGEVMHQRLYPKAYRFRYNVFNLLVDLDDAEAGFPGQRFLSHNRFNLLSFYDRDHGMRTGDSLKLWINHVLHDAGITEHPGRIRVLVYPRILGYQFNPLTVWYCENSHGDMIAIIAEVSNTFGQFHHYLLHEHGQPIEFPFRASADKKFHVSPFIDMPMRYHFRFNVPDERISVHIRETEVKESREDLMLVATSMLRQKAMSDIALIIQCLRIPFLTFKVIGLIHWQALKLWFRGARLFPTPSPPEKEISVCPPNTSNH